MTSTAAAGLAFQFLSIPWQVLLIPFQAAVVVLLYYELRIRKEGLDLTMLEEGFASRAKRG